MVQKHACQSPGSRAGSKREFDAVAEPITDPGRIADFLEMRLRRHTIMVRLIIHLFDGLPLQFQRTDLEKISRQKALVVLHETGSFYD